MTPEERARDWCNTTSAPRGLEHGVAIAITDAVAAERARCLSIVAHNLAISCTGAGKARCKAIASAIEHGEEVVTDKYGEVELEKHHTRAALRDLLEAVEAAHGPSDEPGCIDRWSLDGDTWAIVRTAIAASRAALKGEA